MTDQDLLKHLENMLEQEEGVVRHAYQDSRGFLTIGIGVNIDPRGPGLTDDEVFYLFHNRTEPLIGKLDAHMPWWRSLSENRQLALLDMAFQMGVEGMMGFGNMLAMMQAGLYQQAAQEGMDSVWARETPERARRVTARIAQG